MFCQQCGSQIGESQPFCLFCGANVATRTPRASRTQPQAEMRSNPPRIESPRIDSALRILITVCILLGLGGIALIAVVDWPTDAPDQADTLKSAANTVASNLLPKSDAPPIDRLAVTDRGIVIDIDATDLLDAYQTDEKAADARFKNRKVEVTGLISGLFIPPIDVSLNMAEKGLAASAFVTMGGPMPLTAQETLLFPGIKAYSIDSSLFGQMNNNSGKGLMAGERVTLSCTFGDAFPLSDLGVNQHDGNSGYSITLNDCTVQDSQQAQKTDQGSAPSPLSPEPAVADDQSASIPDAESNVAGTADIANEITKAILAANLGNVTVAAKGNGEVTISGTVPATFVRGEIYRIASRIPGVTFVNDDALASEGQPEPLHPPVALFEPPLRQCLDTAIQEKRVSAHDVRQAVIDLEPGCSTETMAWMDSCMSYGNTNSDCYNVYSTTVWMMIRQSGK